jgi:hypothetical protein
MQLSLNTALLLASCDLLHLLSQLGAYMPHALACTTALGASLMGTLLAIRCALRVVLRCVYECLDTLATHNSCRVHDLHWVLHIERRLHRLNHVPAHLHAPAGTAPRNVLWLPLGDSITWGCDGPTIQDCHADSGGEHRCFVCVCMCGGGGGGGGGRGPCARTTLAWSCVITV